MAKGLGQAKMPSPLLSRSSCSRRGKYWSMNRLLSSSLHVIRDVAVEGPLPKTKHITANEYGVKVGAADQRVGVAWHAAGLMLGW